MDGGIYDAHKKSTRTIHITIFISDVIRIRAFLIDMVRQGSTVASPKILWYAKILAWIWRRCSFSCWDVPVTGRMNESLFCLKNTFFLHFTPCLKYWISACWSIYSSDVFKETPRKRIRDSKGFAIYLLIYHMIGRAGVFCFLGVARSLPLPLLPPSV